jgi:pilus assembly protein CpaC
MKAEIRKQKQFRLSSFHVLVSTFVLSLFLVGAERGAQPQPRPDEVAGQPTATQTEKQKAGEVPAPPEEAPENLHLLVGRSLVVSSPTRIRRVSVADPSIIDTLVVNPNQVLINGKAVGSVSLVLWDESGQSQSFDVFVDLDIRGLTEQIHEVFPDQPVKVEAQKDVVVLSGKVGSQGVADKILEMAKAAAPKAVSMMEVPAPATPGEVLLAVKFAEVDRSAVSQLGVNLISLPGAKNIGTISTQQFGGQALSGPVGSASTSGFTLSDLLNIFVFRPDINLAVTIKALQTQNVLQILAEPNVLTESGKEASFLAGGEFPFPIVQPGGAGAVPVITIQFREFGVKLNFTPTLTPNGTIHLKVRPEVSALDFTQAITVSGFTIPALSTRRVESEMELKDGQSFAIAGLVDNRVTENLNKIPGLGDIPLLGKIFQSRNLNKSKSELLVLVTPRIVKPLAPSEVPPGPYYPVPFLPPAPGEKTEPPGK